MHNSDNCIGPILCGDMNAQKENLDNHKNMLILAYSYPIFLRGLGTRGLMDRIMFFKIRMKVVINIFTTIIRAENSNLSEKTKS